MTLSAINAFIDSLRARVFAFFSRGKNWRRRIALFLAVIGPGIITSNVDNDAGGIATYTQAGSAYGYALLWSLIPMTVALYVTEEMCARMGVVLVLLPQRKYSASANISLSPSPPSSCGCSF